MKISDLKKTEFDSYYGRYIDKLSKKDELVSKFKSGYIDVIDFFSSISEERLLHRYEVDKWTIKEVLQHLIDTERIFMYRCFRIARRDTTSLAGFDQEIYMEPSGANQKTISQLLDEFEKGRQDSISLLESFTNSDLAFIGDANGGSMSARAAAFTIIGHDIWHMEIIKERYL